MLTKPPILVLSMVPAASAAEHITTFIIPKYVIKYKSLCDAYLNSCRLISVLTYSGGFPFLVGLVYSGVLPRIYENQLF